LLGELIRRVEGRAGFCLIAARKIRAYASALQNASVSVSTASPANFSASIERAAASG
jgi:hypothetical protein